MKQAVILAAGRGSRLGEGMPKCLVRLDHRTLIHHQLEALHLQADVVGSGKEALEMLQLADYDVVLMDCSMPEMNGLEAAQALKDQAPGTAVVALTRFNDDAYVAEFMRAGAAAYVLKQSSAAELLKAIRAAAVGERLDRGHHRREARNRAGAKVVAVSESAGENDDVSRADAASASYSSSRRWRC